MKKRESMKAFSNFYLPQHCFNNVCRVCLSKHNVLVPIQEINLTHNLHPMGYTENVDLKTIFQKFCNIEITASDCKPQKICEFCINMVGKAFNFFQLFLYSNALLDHKIHQLSQQESNPNDGYVLSTAENAFDDIRKNKTTVISSHHIDSQDDTIVVEVNSENPISEISKDEIAGTAQRNKSKKICRRSPQQLSNALIDHDYSIILNPIKQTARKSLLKLNRKYQPLHLEKKPGPRTVKRIEEQNDNFKCRFCMKSFLGITKVIRHMKEEHEDVKRCILCFKVFRSTAGLMFHVATHSRNSLVCRMCRLHFETKESLDHHMDNLDHTNIKKCPKCQKTFKRMYLVREHIDTVHLKKANFQCGLCGKMFRYKANLDRHEKNSHGNGGERFLCSVCGKDFTTNYQMKRHVQKIHKVDQGLTIKKYSRNNKFDSKQPRILTFWQCQFCPKKYTSYHLFLMHCEIHLEFKEYVCDVCKEMFETKNEYLHHYKTHNKFKCLYPSCKRMFPWKRLAERHKYTHRKHFRCYECTATFHSKQCLDDHLNVHTGEKPHICDQCGQGFKQRAHLDVHRVALHGGKKPCQCKICGKAFNYISSLKCHMRSHTGQKPFACPFCQKMFRDTTGRHKHVKSDHPKNMKEFLEYKRKYQEDEQQRVEDGSYKENMTNNDTDSMERSSDDNKEQ